MCTDIDCRARTGSLQMEEILRTLRPAHARFCHLPRFVDDADIRADAHHTCGRAKHKTSSITDFTNLIREVLIALPHATGN